MYGTCLHARLLISCYAFSYVDYPIVSLMVALVVENILQSKAADNNMVYYEYTSDRVFSK